MQSFYPSPGPSHSPVSPGWQSGPVLAFIVACLAAMEVYIGAGVVVAAVPLLAVPRLGLRVLLGFGVFVVLKTLIGMYVDMGPAFAIYAFSKAAAGREYVALFCTAMMFVLGYSVMTREAFDRFPSRWLLVVPVLNIAIHAITRRDLFAATADNTQILSLYIMYLVALRRNDNLWPLAAVVLVVLTGAGLRNSFTSVATVVVVLCYVAKGFGLAERVGPFRSSTALYVAAFMLLSLIAYLFVFRVANETGEENNGYTRALLAQFAYRTFADHPFFGTTIGLPAVPSDAIYLLGWTQYLTGEEGANIYGLSFHNSLLYLLTRLGLVGYIFSLWLVVRLIPRRGKLLDIIFTAVPFLFLSANVVLESVRAGPGVALVLGSLFSAATVAAARSKMPKRDALHTTPGWTGQEVA